MQKVVDTVQSYKFGNEQAEQFPFECQAPLEYGISAQK